MSDDGSLFLLALGPVGGTALYWALYRYYRNTDKSHGFERETKVEAKPVTGDDRKTGEVKGTQATRVDGDNVAAYRHRVRRLGSGEAMRTGAPPRDGPGGAFGSMVDSVLSQFRRGGS